MKNYRPWLRDVAIWLNGALRYPSVKKRLSTVVRWSGETHRRRVRGTGDPGNWADFPPDRALSLLENYELVIAIHNAVCTGLKYERLDPRTYWRAGGAALSADLWIIKLRNRVHEIRDHHFNQVREAVKAVGNDLKVNLPRLTPSKRPRKIIRDRVVERHFVPAAPRLAASSKRLGNKARGPRRSRRGKAKVLTKSQEAVVASLEDFKLSIAVVAKQRRCTDKAVYAIYKRAKANPGYGKRRSLNLNNATPIHVNTRRKGDCENGG